MDNSSMLWDKIAELLERVGLPHVSDLDAMFIFAAAFLVLLFILWLIFRNARLWYWKTNIQIDTLKSIDGRLHKVEEKLLQNGALPIIGAEVSVAPEETPEPDETAAEPQEPEVSGLTFIGRSGHIYTEAELELQIRD